MRIIDWSSDVCSSDLAAGEAGAGTRLADDRSGVGDAGVRRERLRRQFVAVRVLAEEIGGRDAVRAAGDFAAVAVGDARSRLRDDDAAAGAAFGAAEDRKGVV